MKLSEGTICLLPKVPVGWRSNKHMIWDRKKLYHFWAPSRTRVRKKYRWQKQNGADGWQCKIGCLVLGRLRYVLLGWRGRTKVNLTHTTCIHQRRLEIDHIGNIGNTEMRYEYMTGQIGLIIWLAGPKNRRSPSLAKLLCLIYLKHVVIDSLQVSITFIVVHVLKLLTCCAAFSTGLVMRLQGISFRKSATTTIEHFNFWSGSIFIYNPQHIVTLPA